MTKTVVEKESRLRELYKHSDERYGISVKYKVKENVIDATKIFKAKQKSDEWWNDALARVNKINGLSNDR